MGHQKGNVGVLVAHLAAGQKLAPSARAAGMSMSTAQRRLRDPAVQAIMREAYADYARETTGRFRDLRNQALDRLGVLLAGADRPEVVLRAIEIALRHAAASDDAWVGEMLTAQASALADLMRNDVRGDL